jgi:hypothetical protein
MGHGRLCRPTKVRSVPAWRCRWHDSDSGMAIIGRKNSFREAGLSEAMGPATTSDHFPVHPRSLPTSGNAQVSESNGKWLQVAAYAILLTRPNLCVAPYISYFFWHVV